MQSNTTLKIVLSGAACALFGASTAFACTPNYEVVHGDTLTGIAVAQVGEYGATHAIYRANRAVIGPNPDHLSIGMKLTLPCGDFRSASANAPAATDVSLGTRSVLEPDFEAASDLALGTDILPRSDVVVNWAVLPDAETANRIRLTEDLQVLDIRRRSLVDEGVIPGTISVPYSIWRGPQGDRSRVPSDADLMKIIGDAGLRPEKPVLIVHNRPNMMDRGRASLIYWLLKSSGFESVAILQDGFSAWKEAGLPIEMTPSDPAPYDADLLFAPTWRATEIDVYGMATKQVAGYLLDARPANMFNKTNDLGELLPTTLPTAQSAPVQPLMSSFASDVPIEEGVRAVMSHLEENNADWNTGKVVMFCQTGELSALSWFYASELAGLDNILLYPESVAGWTNIGGLLFAGGESVNFGAE